MNQHYTIDSIIQTQPDAFNGLSKTFFTTGGKTVYLFHLPQNAPHAGEVLEGTMTADKRGDIKFTKAKKIFTNNAQPAPTPTPASLPIPLPESNFQPKPAPAKEFKADPVKLHQDLNVAKATNMSIQRQVAIKGAVDLIVADKVAYTGLHEAYTTIMELLSEPDWTRFRPPAITDEEPTDEEVDAITPSRDEDIERHMREVFKG